MTIALEPIAPYDARMLEKGWRLGSITCQFPHVLIIYCARVHRRIRLIVAKYKTHTYMVYIPLSVYVLCCRPKMGVGFFRGAHPQAIAIDDD